jgi:transaldolase
MEKQARKIADWGPNVNVKIPITTTTGEFCGPIIERLSKDGICVNVTALMTIHQTQAVANCLDRETPAIISVFAGRIADTGRDPVPIMSECLKILNEHPNAELLWASPRELLNIFQASDIACPIITVGHNLLSKINLIGKDLTEFSRETVSMFFNDAKESGYRIG